MEMRQLREAAGLTIEDVADHLDCSNTKISRLETDKGTVTRADVGRMFARGIEHGTFDSARKAHSGSTSGVQR